MGEGVGFVWSFRLLFILQFDVMVQQLPEVFSSVFLTVVFSVVCSGALRVLLSVVLNNCFYDSYICASFWRILEVMVAYNSQY